MSMQKRPWGKLLSRGLTGVLPGLALACSPAAPSTAPAPKAPEVAPPQPPALISEAGEVPEPADAPTGLTAFTNVLPESIANAFSEHDAVAVDETFIAFGKGVFVFRDLRSQWYGAPPACPVKTEDGCGHFGVVLSEGVQEDFLDASPQSAEVKDWQVAPHHWSGFSPVRDAVYARREGPTFGIDRIDASGKVTPFIEAGEFGEDEWGRFQLVEGGERAFFVGEQPASGELFVAEVVAGAAGRPATIGEPVSLGIAMVPEWRRSAQGARFIEDKFKKRPLYGPLRAVALPDEGPGAWALVWIESLPPPFSHRKGMPYVRKESKGAKHGCGGGPASRPLSDVSVDKRLRITRFDGTAMTSDVVVAKPARFDDDTTRLIVTPTTDGIEINGVTYDRAGKKVAMRKISTAKPPRHDFSEEEGSSLPLTRAEVLEGAAFDVQSGEGVVVVRAGTTFYARTFDALGNFKGEAVTITSSLDSSRSELRIARVGGRWVGARRYSDFIDTLDAGEPLHLSLAERGILIGPGAYFLRNQGQENVWGTLSLTKDALSLSAETHTLEPGYLGHVVDFAQRKPSEPPLLVTARWVGEDGMMALSSELTANGDSLWKRHAEAAIQQTSPSGARLTLHQVWGDVVSAVVEPKGRVTLSWLGTGETKTLDDKQGRLMFSSADYSSNRLYGPLLGSHGALLPSTAGEPVEVPALAGSLSNCPVSLPTGPRRFVMVCAEPVDSLKPAVRVGLRMYRQPRVNAEATR